MANLTVRFYRSEVTQDLQSYTLRVAVQSAVDMPKEVFIFQRPEAPDSDDVFICLADPVDLEEVPINAPDLANEMPYYRLDEVTLLFRDMTTLEEVRDLLAEDLQHLVDSINAIENVELLEEITYA